MYSEFTRRIMKCVRSSDQIYRSKPVYAHLSHVFIVYLFAFIHAFRINPGEKSPKRQFSRETGTIAHKQREEGEEEAYMPGRQRLGARLSRWGKPITSEIWNSSLRQEISDLRDGRGSFSRVLAFHTQ